MEMVILENNYQWACAIVSECEHVNMKVYILEPLGGQEMASNFNVTGFIHQHWASASIGI